ncbi:hypothetical protein FHG87_017096 [Trinorchestia longiramus]|nr:hypothetical protein FHG87_017096 [Trinorchestia longiramus]
MAGKTSASTCESGNCIGADSAETTETATKTSSCRSLVPSSPRSIALYPSAAYRNLHPSASTHHLQASSTFFRDSHQRALHNTRMMNALQSGASGYDQLQFPVTFQRLQNNTDLRLGPSSSSPSFSHSSMHRPHFSSFQMAHEFLECVRHVDVISDAENIKQLLKMPFDPQAEVSLIVHRIENTLLLDPFSVTQLEQHRTDWAWLQRFQALVFQRLINQDHCSAVTKLRSETQQRNRQLLLHMLQCTIQAAQQTYLAAKGAHGSSPVEVTSVTSPSLFTSSTPGEAGHNNAEGGTRSDPCVTPSTAVIPLNLTPAVPCHAETVSVCADEEVMPEPDASDQTPDTCYGDAHARKIIWNFEDVRMLIGTDLPIFGGDSHPCVSLRLHDMAKPITVLTGLDHWLDNLMCNVPEVAMCFHLSGIVQKYEMIKTEELPELTDSQFSPALVKDIAQNILAFLKVNTSEEGHTYWLFKKENDDVVKLYDLTNLKLGDETPDDQGATATSTPDPDAFPDHGANLNPFTVPAGMLFYRVAKSLLQDPDTRRRAATVTDLLHNAIKILQARRYPEIVSSAHFYIAEVLMAEDYMEHEERETDSSADDYDSEPLLRETSNKTSSGGNTNKKNKKVKNTSAQTHSSHSRTGRRLSDDSLRSIKLPQLCLSSTRQTFSRRYRKYRSLVPPHRGTARRTVQCRAMLLGLLDGANRPPRLTQNFSSRCTSALSHVAQGLQCVLAKEKGKESKSRCPEGLQDPEGSSSAQGEPKMARRNESIPLPYESIQVTQQTNSQVSDSIQEKSRSASTLERTSSFTDGQKTSNQSSPWTGQNSSVCWDAGTGVTTERGGFSRGRTGREPVDHDIDHASEGGSTKMDSGSQMSHTGWKGACSSEGVDTQCPPSGAASTGGPGAVVPSSTCLWVQLSSVRYGVSTLTTKLKLLLLHQAALGYKIIASHAFHNKLFSKAADNVDLCVRCCVAVSHQLQLDTALPCDQDYPLMKEALGLASEIFYDWAKTWEQGPAPVKTGKKTSKKSNKKHPEGRASGACEYNCTAATDGGDTSSDEEGLSDMTNGKMMLILEQLVPRDYRVQFEMPVSPSSAYACMMLSQCYLFLEAGGRLNATSVLHTDPPVTDTRGTRMPLVDLTPGCSLRLNFQDEMIHRSPDIVARLADVMNEMACFQINMVQNACMCADERQCELLLEALAADREHLTTAVSLFLTLGDTDNAAISLANLAKYHRLCAYFSPSRIKSTVVTVPEVQHYRQAAASYKQALWYIDQHIQAGSQPKGDASKGADAKPTKRRNLLSKRAGDRGLTPKKSFKAQRKTDSLATDRPEASPLQADDRASCKGKVVYEPRQLSIEQAKDLSEKLKLDLVRTLTAHADCIIERGLSESEAGAANAVELLLKSVSVMRTLLAQSSSVNCCVLLARNSLRIVALRSGLSREVECEAAEWLPVVQSLQAALYSRHHYTAALLCCTATVFSLLTAQSGNKGECVRACVTCLVQSCYVVASYISNAASDLPLIMEDGRRFELSLPDFGLLCPSQDVLAWQLPPQAPCGVVEQAGGVGGGVSRISATEDKTSTSAAGARSSCSINKTSNDNTVKRETQKDNDCSNSKSSKKNIVIEAKGNVQMKKKSEESSNNQNNRKEERNKSGRSNKKNRKARVQKQHTEEKNSDEEGEDTSTFSGKTQAWKTKRHHHNVSNDEENKARQCSSGNHACNTEGNDTAKNADQKNTGKEKVEEEDNCSGRSWNDALLVEYERCLRTALQRLCRVATKAPYE